MRLTRTWRLRYLLREAALNARSGGPRTVALLVLMAALFGGAATFEAVLVQSIAERDVDLNERGRYVMRISPGSSNPGILRAAACEQLASQGGILGAGSLMGQSLIEVRSSPGVRLRLIEASPGAMSLLGLVPEGSATAVVVGSEAAAELGLVEQSRLLLGSDDGLGGAFIVQHIASISPRLPEANRAVIVSTVAAGAASACYVEAEPAIFRDYRNGGIAGLAALSDGDLQIATLVPVEEGQGPGDQYSARPSRYAALVASLIAAALVGISLQTRRSEIGLYRTTGTPRPALFTIFFIEHVIVIALAASIAMIGVAGAVRFLGIWRQPALHAVSALAVSVSVAALGTALVVAAGVVQRNVLQALKDR